MLFTWPVQALSSLSSRSSSTSTPEAQQTRNDLLDLIRTFLSDSYNEALLKSLKESVPQAQVLSAQERIDFYRFVDLVDFQRLLKKRLDELRGQNEALLADLSQVEWEEGAKADIDRARSKLRRIASSQLPESATMVATLTGWGVLKAVNLGYEKQNQALLNDHKALRDLNKDLRRIQMDAVTRRAGYRRTVMSTSHKPAASPKTAAAKPRSSSGPQAQKQLSETVGNDLIQLRARIKRTEKRMVELTRELANMSLEIYQKDALLADKDQQYQDLEKELNDTRQRLSLVSKIIADKDKIIKKMDQEFNAFSASLKTSDDQLWSVASFATKQDENSAGKIADLERRVQQLQVQFRDMEMNLIAKDQQIFLLQETISSQNDQLKNYQNIYASKDEKIFELKGIVDIYKWRLDETTATLNARNADLSLLKNQLLDLEAKLDRLDLLSETTDQEDKDTVSVQSTAWQDDEPYPIKP